MDPEQNTSPVANQPLTPDPVLDQPITPGPEPQKHTKAPMLLVVLLLLLIIAGAVYWLLKDKDQTNKTPAPAHIYSRELDKIKLQKIPESSGSIIFYADDIGHYVAVDGEPEKSFEANMKKQSKEVKIDYVKLKAEVEAEYLQEYQQVEVKDPLLKKREKDLNETRYKKDGSLCALRLEKSASIGLADKKLEVIEGYTVQAGTIQLACTNDAVVQAKGKFMKPFYDAYLANKENAKAVENAEYTLLLSVDENNIKDSTVEGYEYAIGGAGCVVACGGAGVYFARTVAGIWEFVVATQSGIICEEVVTEVSRKALAELDCWLPNGEELPQDKRQTTIGEYYNL